LNDPPGAGTTDDFPLLGAALSLYVYHGPPQLFVPFPSSQSSSSCVVDITGVTEGTGVIVYVVVNDGAGVLVGDHLNG
jgi:hypothetical protein